MARESVKTTKEGGTAVEDAPDIGEQGNMFPDLDKSKPKEAELLKASKSWLSIRDKRKEYLSDAKEKEDEAREKMIELAKAVGIKAYSVGERQIDLEDSTKVKVRQKKEKTEDEDTSDDD